MERKVPLDEMGEKIRKIRKSNHLNQTQFYRKLFPEKDLQDENIKKKMYKIENGLRKEVDYELLFRIREVFDVSLDYLFGYETEYPNYENEAASNYTGLSSEAISQLHYWSKYKGDKVAIIPENATDDERKELFKELSNRNEAKWILNIASKLFEHKSEEDEKVGISDLSILYDIYMMTLDPPDYICGFSDEPIPENASLDEKFSRTIRMSSDAISFSDKMGEIHIMNIKDINQKIWEERLLEDAKEFASWISKKHKG